MITTSSAEQNVYLSIVIRTRNEAGNLKGVFSALSAQRCNFKWEVVVVDNESEDTTLELCREYGARVVNIGRDEFTYGRALNRGISQARGELVMLLSAHSLPVGSYFLKAAVESFDDPLIAAVRCLRSNSDQLLRWYNPVDIHYDSPIAQKDAERGLEWTCIYPAANGCVLRRCVWEQVPYDEKLVSAEDKLWASQVLSKGYKVRCCAEAVYVYTRKRRLRDEWRRHSLDYQALYQISGYVPLSWPKFALRVAKALLCAPLVAIEYLFKTVAWNTHLVLVPWKAKSPHRAGSHPEFEKGRYPAPTQPGVQNRNNFGPPVTHVSPALHFEERAGSHDRATIHNLRESQDDSDRLTSGENHRGPRSTVSGGSYARERTNSRQG